MRRRRVVETSVTRAARIPAMIRGAIQNARCVQGIPEFYFGAGGTNKISEIFETRYFKSEQAPGIWIGSAQLENIAQDIHQLQT